MDGMSNPSCSKLCWEDRKRVEMERRREWEWVGRPDRGT